jgi:hypothetical protein
MKVKNKLYTFSPLYVEWSTWNGYVFNFLYIDGIFFNKNLENSFFGINFGKQYLYIDIFFKTFKIIDRLP